ncbi:tetratricopeptide repeat protein [Bradyrhizobium sp. 1050_B9_N1_2]|uniref:tetratricopeptide repeat protein n=1 Tax=Bradyrhizobium sp. 1050_B9_N1_2 TaxID=3238688 RepID=UPI003EDCAD54
MLRLFASGALKTGLASAASASAGPAHERYLSEQLDRLRDGAKGTDPDTNLKLFHSFLDSLPEDASATIRFRAKANIGLQHLARGGGPEAIRWLLEAYDQAPDDPRAIANRTLALFLRGDAEEAHRFGCERLALDPTNEALAAYLPQVAVKVHTVTDGLDGIPEGLRDKESVLVGEAVFLRGRNVVPRWWDYAKAALAQYPGSEHLKMLAAFADVDEISRDDTAQRTLMVDAGQRARLAAAAALLEADWRAKPWLLTNGFDDAVQTLSVAMIAYRFLHDREKALAHAERLADEGIKDPGVLLSGVMVALSFGSVDLARRLIALAPNDPDLAFQAGLIAVRDNKWSDAVALFAKANIPDNERRVTETAIALAPIAEAGRPADGSPADPAALKALISTFRDSARGLVLVAQVATTLGLDDVAESAFEAAVEAVPEDCHISTRLMVAHAADRAGSPATVIRLLDVHLPFDGFDDDFEMLSVAHANEHPHRERNLAFFNRLPARLRDLHSIARAHASVLLDVGRLPEAIKLLRRLHAEDSTDAFVTMRLVDALRYSGDTADAAAVLRAVDLSRSVGIPEHIMRLAHEVLREGDFEKAYVTAYELVRRHANNSNIALGYAGLGLMNEVNPMFTTAVAGLGAYVAVEAPDGLRQDFVIDEGADFFGMNVLPATSGIAARVMGLRRGDTFEMPKFGLDQPEIWKVVEVKSKYLHLQHRVFEEFETRFPDKPGLARYTVGQDNIDTVLDVVRRSAEQNIKNAQVYMENAIPLAAVARGLGGDVVSFAQFVRKLGGRIVTCAGNLPERTQAVRLARNHRRGGAVLDAYTAWVAAEIGILPVLKTWFGTLQTPTSTVAMIDRMIRRENDGRGRRQMTISYQDGQFYRNEVTDGYRDHQIAAINRVRDCIEQNCEVVQVLVPDDISETTENLLAVGGSRFLDAAFLAARSDALLLSDDMRFRQLAAEATGIAGTWLQAALLAATESRQLAASEYAKGVVGLARNAHDHVVLNGPLLYVIARQDEDGFPGLRMTLQCLGGPKAEMRSHLNVFIDFVALLWPPNDVLDWLKTRAATGLSLEIFLSIRSHDWAALLGEILLRTHHDRALARYLSGWLRGHFITQADVANALATAAPPRRRRRKAA